jgi:hypothetical protein
MSRSLRLALLAAIAAALTFSAWASADPGGAKVLDASLVALPSSATGGTLQGVQAGGLPWRMDMGSARLFADGRLQVAVHGLVLDAGAAAGTNPIATARAIVTCDGSPVAMSAIVPYSEAGDASINDRVELPSPCLAPAVFFAGVTGAGPRWFAVTGE